MGTKRVIGVGGCYRSWFVWTVSPPHLFHAAWVVGSLLCWLLGLTLAQANSRPAALCSAFALARCSSAFWVHQRQMALGRAALFIALVATAETRDLTNLLPPERFRSGTTSEESLDIPAFFPDAFIVKKSTGGLSSFLSNQPDYPPLAS